MNRMGRVKVYVRIRPSLSGECCIEKLSQTCLYVDSDSPAMGNDFECDGIIDPSETNGISNLVHKNSLAGHGDLLIVGYGHSGTGKTFTIFGPDGVVESISQEFFEKRKPSSLAFLDVSFLEVYNEKVFDLLAPPEGSLKSLQVLEDIHRNVCVKNLSRIRVENSTELNAVIAVGMAQRAEAENAIHFHSSRSHAILQLTRPSGESVWLCDLAGSERAKKFHQQSRANRELNSIHKSLHALRRCIMALKGNEYVPARSSVLSRILFGSARIVRCVLIACVAPDRESVQETVSTLDFAASGLAVQTWAAMPQFRSLTEAEQLRSALEKVTKELEKEKARRMELEHEITRHSTPSFWVPQTRVTSTEPPMLVDSSVSSSASPQLFQEQSIKFSPSPKEKYQRPMRGHGDNLDDSVMSQTWRHNQYDAILKRCWMSS
jgi:hypothetical protein